MSWWPQCRSSSDRELSSLLLSAGVLMGSEQPRWTVGDFQAPVWAQQFGKWQLFTETLLEVTWRQRAPRGVCVLQSSSSSHSKPGKRGFTLGKWEINPQKIKKKWWEFLFSSVLVFVLLLPPCMLNEIRSKKFVETLLCLRKRSAIFLSLEVIF